MKEIHNVLWTSGWDSTYRVIELVLKGVTIQPYYVIDKNRISYKKEMDTIHLLKKQIIETYPKTKHQILKTILINRKDIKHNLIYKLSYKVLKKRAHIGSQYYWLACLSKKINNLEVSVHDKGQIALFFLKDKTNIETHPDIGKYYKLNPDVKDFFLKTIFGNMRFPVLGLEKLDMKKIAEEKGFIHIMNNTWFCHNSTEKPCRECSPCKQVIRDGMEYRLY